jgi:DNA-directed RNA polymerase subunit RPC12/RpoP
MATLREVTYKCEQCGSGIVVKETGKTELSPIYCCGAEIRESRSTERKRARPKKKAVKKEKGE